MSHAVLEKLSDEFPYVLRVRGGEAYQPLRMYGTAILVHHEWALTSRHVAAQLAHLSKVKGGRVRLQLYKKSYSISVQKIICHSDNDLDLAAIRLREPLIIQLPTLLQQIREEFSPILRQQIFLVEGYPKKGNGKRDTKHCECWMPTFTEDKYGVKLLKDMQLKGGPSKGNSGGAVLIKKDNQIVCMGSMWLGDDGSATSHFVSSDEMLMFMKDELHLDCNNIKDAEAFFNSIQQQLLPEQKQPLQLALTTKPSEGRHHKARKLLWATVPICILLVTVAAFSAKRILERKSRRSQQERRILPEKHSVSPALQACAPLPEERFLPKQGLQGLNVLVLAYATSPHDTTLGQDIGQKVWSALQSYKEELGKEDVWSTSKLSTRDIQTRFNGKCTADEFNRARQIGELWAADIVLWGRIPTVSATQNSSTGIILSPGVTVVQGPPMQSVATQGLHYSDPSAIYDLSLPQLTDKNIMASIHCMIGLYAYYNRAYGLAAHQFDMSFKNIPLEAKRHPKLLALIAESYLKGGNPELGLERAKEAEQNCTPNDDFCFSYARGWQASGNYELGKYTEAINLAQSALSRLEGIPDHALDKTRVSILSVISSAYKQIGQNKLADWYASQALFFATQSIDDKNDYASCTNNLAMASSHAGNSEAAINQSQRAFQQAKEENNVYEQVRALANLGTLSYQNKEFRKAQEYLLQAQKLNLSSGDITFRASMLHGLGLAYEGTGDISKAERSYHEALTLFNRLKVNGKDNKMSIEELSLHELLGDIYYRGGKYREALEQYKQAVAHVGVLESGGQSVLAEFYAHLADIYEALNEHAAAIKYYDKALQILEPLQLPIPRAQTLASRGQALMALERYREALNDIRTAIFIYYRASHLDEAASLLEKSLELFLEKKRISDSITLVDDMVQVGFRELRVAQHRARVWGNSADLAQARVAYQQMEKLAEKHHSFSQTEAETSFYIARAGLARLAHGNSFVGCPGLVLIGFDSPPPANNQYQLGDVLVKQGTTCLKMVNGKLRPSGKVVGLPPTYTIWRNGSLLNLSKYTIRLMLSPL